MGNYSSSYNDCDCYRSHDDVNMIFSRMYERYVPTPLAIRNALSIDLKDVLNQDNSINPSMSDKEFCNTLSILVYNSIYDKVTLKEDVKLLLAIRKEYRPMIFEIMMLAAVSMLELEATDVFKTRRLPQRVEQAIDNMITMNIRGIGRPLTSRLPLVARDGCSE